MPGDLGGNPIGHRCTGQKPVAHGECGDIVVWRGKGAVESALRDVECFQEGTALRNRRCLIHCDNLRRSVAASANCGEQQRYSLAVRRSKSKDRRHLALTDCIGNLLRGEVSSANAGRINIVMLQDEIKQFYSGHVVPSTPTVIPRSLVTASIAFPLGAMKIAASRRRIASVCPSTGVTSLRAIARSTSSLSKALAAASRSGITTVLTRTRG